MAQTEVPDGLRFSWRQKWLLVNRPRSYAAGLHERFGDVAALHAEPNPMAMTLTPAGAREVFTADPDSLEAFFKESFTGAVGPGSLWVLDGPRHRQERALLASPFQARCFHSYGPQIQAIARRHTDGWQPGQELVALHAMMAISLEFILRLTFGAENEITRDEGRDIMGEMIATLEPLFIFFPRLQSRWFLPWVRHARALDHFTRFVYARLNARRERGLEANDLVGRMMAARYEDGSSMSDSQIRDELITILGAGHETTATALAWALYELGRHPAVLARLREELDALGPAPEAGAVVRQPYLNAVCNETLRRRVILTEVARVVGQPVTIFGYTIPSGWAVGVSIVSIHQNPRLYPEPDRFRPERFLERSFGPFEFLPFGGGHRRCLGAALSDYEMRLVLAHIVTHWDYEVTTTEKEARLNIAMGPRRGAPMRLLGRRQSVMPQEDLQPAMATAGDR